MKNWENTTFNTIVREGVVIEAVFKYIGDKTIKSVNKSCDCTGYKWEDPNTLRVDVQTGFVKSNVHPKLYEQGKKDYQKKTSVTVVYEDGTTEKLIINGKVVEPSELLENEG